ncbi:MAG: excalibur calcium-binding domain-containing protein [Caryophanon sp.]|nr:excalibur calcium-binding domain-containing protein [Caryophanon sp.]
MTNSTKKKSSLFGCLIFVVLAFGSCAVALPEEENEPVNPVKSEPVTEVETNTEADKLEAERKAEEQRQAEEAERQADEETRKAAEQRQAEEAERQAEAQRQAEEAERQAETQRQAEEAERQAEAQRQAEEAERQAEAQRQAEEEQQAPAFESYKNCDALRAVHPDGVPAGHAAYDDKHDRDKDGWACEN